MKSDIRNQLLLIPKVSLKEENIFHWIFRCNRILILQAYYNVKLWFFIIIFKNAYVWIKAVAGRLKTDYRYSNTFATIHFPSQISQNNEKKNLLNAH